MHKIKYIFLVVFCLTQLSFVSAKNPRSSFFETVKSTLGDFKLSKSKENSKECSTGSLALVGKSVDEGIRLGHHIFLGPFTKQGDISDSKDYCKISVQYNFTKNTVTETTQTSDCPESAKMDEGRATKILKLSDNKIDYSIKETNFRCSYEKIKRDKQ